MAASSSWRCIVTTRNIVYQQTPYLHQQRALAAFLPLISQRNHHQTSPSSIQQLIQQSQPVYRHPSPSRLQQRRLRFFSCSPRQNQTYNPDPQPGVNLPVDSGDGGKSDDSKKRGASGGGGNDWTSTIFKMFEAAMTTLASVAILGVVGYSYTVYYKTLVLNKMENAFTPGDPVLDLAAKGKGILTMSDPESDSDNSHWIVRDEQPTIDAIVSGQLKGSYHLILGEKGTGKSSMLIDAMSKIDGEGVAMFDAHADLEIFRVRLGKALDFEYHEDNIGSLFSIKGPRDASALLDIERAFNKLEKVALRRRARVGRPLVIIVNSVHLLRDDDDGRSLLELVQQRSESWASSNLATVVLVSDDYWVYERLKQLATRMQVMQITDLPKHRALEALRNYRIKYHQESASDSILDQVYATVGGRLSYLNRVSKAKDMLKACDDIVRMERTWFLNQCWILGPEMDDDVMDQQKYASAAMVLAKALVDREAEMAEGKEEDPESLERALDGFGTGAVATNSTLPQIPLNEARQIMTRADFIQSYDHVNLFTIDANAMVRADSMPMQIAFRQICALPNFDEHLEGTLQRISDIESLGRTRELVMKDLVKGDVYVASTSDAQGKTGSNVTYFQHTPPSKEDDDEKDKD